MRFLAALVFVTATAAAAPPCTFPTMLKKLANDSSPPVKTLLWPKEATEGARWVWAVEARALWLVGEPADAHACRHPNLLVSRRLDLEKDVVAKDEDVGSSTYLVTEAWAGRILYGLAKRGERWQGR